MDTDPLIRLRHWLHAHPELSRGEEQTARYIRSFLNDYAPPDALVDLYGAGFAAIYNGRSAGRTVMFRCELDALPIHEVNTDLPYRSVVDGVAHKCGHDGHMAIMAGLAQSLIARPDRGRVVLLFQPDEETGTGARLCARHRNFAQIAPDFVFALHNLPGFPAGQVICRAGTFASEVKYAAIRLIGTEAHSAQPETGCSPATALAGLMLHAAEIQAKYDRGDAYALAVPVYSRMGVQASGIAPALGEVHFTLRAALGETVALMWGDLCTYATKLAEHAGLQVEFETREEFAATMNAQTGCDMVRQAAAMTNRPFRQLDQPFRWGEDFGELTARYQGAMFGLGAGENRPDLHNPDYDFPDAILPDGIAMFRALITLAT